MADDKCILRHNSIDYVNHIFRICPDAARIWGAITSLGVLQSLLLVDFDDWVRVKFEGKVV